MTLKEIDEQIAFLNQERRKLEKEARKKFKKEAQKNVGRCFRINKNIFAKVIDIPQEENRMNEVSFNEYQYPAIFLRNVESIHDCDVPIWSDTLFSGAWGVGNNIFKTLYEEITLDEFNKELEKVFEKIRSY